MLGTRGQGLVQGGMVGYNVRPMDSNPLWILRKSWKLDGAGTDVAKS